MTVRLELALFDGENNVVALADLPRTPLIGWYVRHDDFWKQRQAEARTAVAFEASFSDAWPSEPLANVVGGPVRVLYTAPANASGWVVVRAVLAAADCAGEDGARDPYAAARWDGPCSGEFSIKVAPAPPPLPTPTPTPVPCEGTECVKQNLCRGVECLDEGPHPRPCRGYNCIEAVPYAFERRVFGPGEPVDWEKGLFLFHVDTGVTEAYRVLGAGDSLWYTPSASWVQVEQHHTWHLLLHRQSGRAWRWAAGALDQLAAYLREELGLDYPPFAQDLEITWPPDSGCPGLLSPNGRYVAQQWGHPSIAKWHRIPPPNLYSVPSVVVVDAETCEPLFRVHSAYAYAGFWEGTWLPDGDGLVLAVEDGYAITRVSDPTLVPLPAGPPGHAVTYAFGPIPAPAFGPVPAPTGSDRYFLYGYAGVYDRRENVWATTGFPSLTMAWSAWGETHEEAWYQPGFFEGGGVSWVLSSPTVEYPPFEEVAFRVRQADGCLDLRETPSGESKALDCLPYGARVTLLVAPPNEWSDRANCGHFTCLPATRTGWDGGSSLDWVYVRSERGIEGWVPYGPGESVRDYSVSPYLEHD